MHVVLLGHSPPLTGFGYAARIPLMSYAHGTWDAMVATVERLEHLLPRWRRKFGLKSDKCV